MKTFLGFVTGLLTGAIVMGCSTIVAMSVDEQYAKGILMMAGYNFKTPSETKKEYEAK